MLLGLHVSMCFQVKDVTKGLGFSRAKILILPSSVASLPQVPLEKKTRPRKNESKKTLEGQKGNYYRGSIKCSSFQKGIKSKKYYCRGYVEANICVTEKCVFEKKKLPPRCRRKGAYAFEKKIRRTKLEQKPSVSACRLLLKKYLPFFATQICIWNRRPLLCPTRVPPYLRSVLLLLAYMNIQLHMYVLRLYTVYVRCHCYMCAPQQEKGRQRKPLIKAMEQSSKYMKGKDKKFLAFRIAANLFSLAFRETIDNCSSLLFESEKRKPYFFLSNLVWCLS